MIDVSVSILRIERHARFWEVRKATVLTNVKMPDVASTHIIISVMIPAQEMLKTFIVKLFLDRKMSLGRKVFEKMIRLSLEIKLNFTDFTLLLVR